MSANDHDLEIETSFDGWIKALCSCGWSEGPFVAQSDAVDAWGDHRAEEARV